MIPDFVRDHPDDAHHDAAEHRRRFPDGRIGSDPGLATAEAGRRLLASAVAEASDDYRRFLAEEQP